jgi:hypothetical protein
MCPEKVAQTHERTDRFYICGWFSIFDHFQFVFPWFDAFRGQCKTKVGHFLAAEKALV